jgi:autotransporter translocation and assembly factor TamB
MRRLRRLLVRLGLALLALVVGTAIVAFALLAYLRSEGGRARLLRMLTRRVPTLSAARLGGDLLRSLSLEQAVLRDRDRQIAVRIREIDLEYTLGDLVGLLRQGRPLRIVRLRLEDPEVLVRRGADGRINLTELVPAGPSSGRRVALTLSDVHIQGGVVELALGGTVTRLFAIEGHGRLALGEDRLEAALDALAFEVASEEARFAVRARGSVESIGGLLDARLEEAAIEGLFASPVALSGSARGSAADLLVDVQARLPAGGQLHLGGRLQPAAGLRYQLAARFDFDPDRLRTGLPGGRLEGTLDLSGSGVPVVRDGQARVRLSLGVGSLFGFHFAAASAAGRLDGRAWRLEQGRLRAAGIDVAIAGHGVGPRFAATVDGRLASVRALPWPRLREALPGGGEVHAALSGTWPEAIFVRSRLSGRGFQWGGLKAGSIDIEIEGQGSGPKPRRRGRAASGGVAPERRPGPAGRGTKAAAGRPPGIGSLPFSLRGRARIVARDVRLGDRLPPLDSVVLELAGDGRSFTLRAQVSGRELRLQASGRGLVRGSAIDLVLATATGTVRGQRVELLAPTTLGWDGADELSLGSTRLALLGGTAQLAGRVALASRLLLATLELTHVELAAVGAVSGRLHALADDRRLELRAQGAVGDGQTPVSLHATAPLAQAVRASWPQLADSGAITLSATARHIPLELLAGERAAVLPGGAMTVELGARGDLHGPELFASVQLEESALLGRLPVSAWAQLTGAAGALTVTGGLRVAGAQVATLTGSSRLDPLAALHHGSLPAATIQAQAVVAGVDVAVLRPLAPRFGDASGLLRGRLSVAGTLREPTVAADFTLSGARFGGVSFGRITASASARAGVEHVRLEVPQQGGGHIALALSRSGGRLGGLDASLRGVDVRFLPVVVPQLAAAAGRLDGNLRIEPDASGEPTLVGAVTLSQGLLRGVGLAAIEDIDLAAHVLGGRAELDRLSARSGGGTLQVGGTLGLDGLQPGALDLTAVARGFQLAYGGLVRARLDGQVRVTGEPQASRYAITISLGGRGVELLETARGRDLQPIGPLSDVRFVDRAARAKRQARSEEREQMGTALARIDLKLAIPAPLPVRGKEIDADVQGEVELFATPEGAALSGELKVVRGQVEVFRQRFDIERARIYWQGGTDWGPQVDVRVVRQFSDARVFVGVTGTLASPELSLWSDPPVYNQAQLVAMVLSGRPSLESGAPGGNDVSALGTVSTVVLGQIVEKIAPSLPIDVLRFDLVAPEVSTGPLVAPGSGSAATEPRGEAGWYLSSRIYVSLVFRTASVAGESSLEGHVSWRLSRRWAFETFAGDAGFGADLFWTWRY